MIRIAPASMRGRWPAAVILPTIVLVVRTTEAPIRQKFDNVQVFPGDVSRDTLLQAMREFAFALGFAVRPATPAAMVSRLMASTSRRMRRQQSVTPASCCAWSTRSTLGSLLHCRLAVLHRYESSA